MHVSSQQLESRCKQVVGGAGTGRERSQNACSSEVVMMTMNSDMPSVGFKHRVTNVSTTITIPK